MRYDDLMTAFSMGVKGFVCFAEGCDREIREGWIALRAAIAR